MNDANQSAPVQAWLAGPLKADVAQSVDRLCRAPDVRHVAVMPDVHLADEVCVGLAVATERLIYPAAVGSDIGCGMAAVGFDASADLLADEKQAARLLEGLYRSVSSLKRRRETASVELPAALLDAPLSDPRLEKLKRRDGRVQLGTLGRGNHFVEFQADETDRLWLMVHSGSRGMGQAITAHHLRVAAENPPRTRLASFDAESPAGQEYLNDAAWAVLYAEQNRLAIVAAIEQLMAELFGAAVDRDSLIHANHNHVRREEHFGRMYWVHRKGALSAGAGERGVIPGSMGAASFHVVGRGCEAALRSSSHGAGRQLSRAEAARQISARELERQMRGVWFDHRRMILLRDEAPAAYKDIRAVMQAQHDLTKIERRLRPLLSYKGL